MVAAAWWGEKWRQRHVCIHSDNVAVAVVECSVATGDNQTRLGVSSLDRLVHSLIGRGAADSTLRAYTSGKNRYREFCDHFPSPSPACW